jgi:7TM-HD extracellular
MVTPAPRMLLPALAIVGIALSGLASDVAEYRLGDVITNDIVTPVTMTVLDAEATQALKDKAAGQSLPMIFRYDVSARAAVDAQLRESFTQARSNFLFQVQDSFRRPRLTGDQMVSEQFQILTESFKRRNPAFPLTLEMAMEWASGNVLVPEQITLCARIHQAMAGLINDENLTDPPPPGNEVLLVPVKGETETLTLADADARGTNESWANLLSLSEARQGLRELFSPADEELAKFAAVCLRANCFGEKELTRAAHARQTQPKFVTDHYEIGQIIARKGQVVDAKILAALTQLQARTPARQPTTSVAQKPAPEKNAPAPTEVERMRASNRLLLGALAVTGTMLLLLLAWLALRPRRGPVTMPALADRPTAPPLLSAGHDTGLITARPDSWEQRALAAEQKAERAHAAIREGFLAQLNEKLVGSLASQREQLLEAQRSAAVEMAEMEQRLNELHAPLQERLRAYETRIAELERALAAKGEENRELIKAKIALMQRQLRTEKLRNTLQFG